VLDCKDRHSDTSFGVETYLGLDLLLTCGIVCLALYLCPRNINANQPFEELDSV
jgi:hypothetical protein